SSTGCTRARAPDLAGRESPVGGGFPPSEVRWPTASVPFPSLSLTCGARLSTAHPLDSARLSSFARNAIPRPTSRDSRLVQRLRRPGSASGRDLHKRLFGSPLLPSPR